MTTVGFSVTIAVTDFVAFGRKVDRLVLTEGATKCSEWKMREPSMAKTEVKIVIK